jgi:hypothetical protein
MWLRSDHGGEVLRLKAGGFEIAAGLRTKSQLQLFAHKRKRVG